MPSPIAMYRVTGSEPETKDYTLTLEFTLRSCEDLNQDELAKMLQDVLEYTQDGRHTFNAETMQAGLFHCLRQAERQVIESQAQDEFGREVVPRKNGNDSRWSLEADKRFAKWKKAWFTNAIGVKINLTQPLSCGKITIANPHPEKLQ